jgi:hypothetical protein
MDRFEADVMDDLMYEAAEGPATRNPMNAGDEYDEAGEWDGADEGDDEFAGPSIGGQIVRSRRYDEADETDEADEWDGGDEGDEFEASDEYDAIDEADTMYSEFDAMEEAVADALDAGDSDEFFRRLSRIARSAVNVARTVGRGIGQAARVVGPIASMIPLPQAQLIGRIANVAGRLLADGADEFEMLDDLVDGLDEESVDAAAPVLAGVLLRRALPSVARATPSVRRAAVHGIAQAMRTAARAQGVPATRAVARAVRATRSIAQRRQMAPPAAARIAMRAALAVARRPQTARRLSRPLVPTSRRATPRGQGARAVARNVAPIARRVAATGSRGRDSAYGCPHCGRRHLRLQGPVTIIIRGR